MINLEKMPVVQRNNFILQSIKKPSINDMDYDQLIRLLNQFKKHIQINHEINFSTFYNIKSIDYVINLIDAYSLINSIKS